MTRPSKQAGEGNVGCIFWLVVIGAAAYVLWTAVPVKIASATFYDHIVETAKFSGRKNAAQLRKEIMAKARELDLPVKEKDLVINKTRERVRVRCKYTVPLEFPGYTYYWTFEHDVARDIFYA